MSDERISKLISNSLDTVEILDKKIQKSLESLSSIEKANNYAKLAKSLSRSSSSLLQITKEGLAKRVKRKLKK